MREFAAKQNQLQRPKVIDFTRSSRVLPNRAKDHVPDSSFHAPPTFAYDFSWIPLRPASARIQPKLKISTPGDIYEQEADRVAEQVISMPPRLRVANYFAKLSGEGPCLSEQDSAVGGQQSRVTLELVEETSEEPPESSADEATAENSALGEENGAQNPPAIRENAAGENVMTKSDLGFPRSVDRSMVSDVLSAPGQKLDAETRTFMEQRFGHYFGHVRVHADNKASLSAQALGARAYTVGSNIVFQSESYAPRTLAGRRLLAHELTHVAQQTGSARRANSGPLNQITISRAPQPLMQHQVDVSIAEVKPSDQAKSEHLSNPNEYGRAWPEELRVKITARRALASWKAHLKGLAGWYSRQVRLLPGPPQQQEVPRDLGKITKEDFCGQVTELSSLGKNALNPQKRWYMLDSVKAHENVHISRFKPALENIVPLLKVMFNKYTKPTVLSAPGKKPRKVSRAEAVGQLMKDPEIQSDVGIAYLFWRDEATKLIKNDHDGPTAVAEHEVVDPIVKNICDYANDPLRQAQGWGSCPACRPAGPIRESPEAHTERPTQPR
jgi:hypothetical protein